MMNKYKIGGTVVKNPLQWQPDNFDSWKCREGVEEIVEPSLNQESEWVDVRWSTGRCIEFILGISPYEEK